MQKWRQAHRKSFGFKRAKTVPDKNNAFIQCNAPQIQCLIQCSTSFNAMPHWSNWRKTLSQKKHVTWLELVNSFRGGDSDLCPEVQPWEPLEEGVPKRGPEPAAAAAAAHANGSASCLELPVYSIDSASCCGKCHRPVQQIS